VVELDADRPRPKHSVTSRIVGLCELKTLIHRARSHRRTPCSRSRARLSLELMAPKHGGVTTDDVNNNNNNKPMFKRVC
jgi:hypothetical protein